MLRHGGHKLLKLGQRLQLTEALQPLRQAPFAVIDTCERCIHPQCRGFATPAEEDDQDVVPPSPRVVQLAEDIMHLNLLEVADLTDILQKRLGIASGFGGMPMGMMPAQGAAQAAAPAAAEPVKEPEKTEFDVKLEGFDAAAKIKVIKEVRVITELGLKEAKELVEKSPVVIKSGLKKEEAEELKKKIEAVGGKIALE